MSINTKGFGSRPALPVREINSAEGKDLLEKKNERQEHDAEGTFPLFCTDSCTTRYDREALSTTLHQLQPAVSSVLHPKSDVYEVGWTKKNI